MLNLKRIGGAGLLICAFALTALADCPAPGVMEGPPCTPVAQKTPEDPTATAASDEPAAATAESPYVDLTSLVEVALNALMLF